MIHIAICDDEKDFVCNLQKLLERYAKEQGQEIKTTKEDKFLHGFGLSNIKKAVEKYGGSYTANAEKDVFKLKL